MPPLTLLWEARQPHSQCAQLRIKWSGFTSLWYVLGQDTLLPQCLSRPRCINGYWRNAGGNPAMDWHPILRGVSCLVASCFMLQLRWATCLMNRLYFWPCSRNAEFLFVLQKYLSKQTMFQTYQTSKMPLNTFGGLPIFCRVRKSIVP